MSMEKKDLSISYMDYSSTMDEENEEGSVRNSLFFGLFDNPESIKLRNGSMKRQYSDMGDSYHRSYEEQEQEQGKNDVNYDNDKASKIDMRVLMVLEYMRELYVGQLQVLKKMFPGGGKDDFLGFFNKIGDAMSQFKKDPQPDKALKMQRSLSAGLPGVTLRSVNLGSDLKDERFKITTVSAGDAPAGTSSGGGGAAGGGKGATAGQGPTKK